MYQFSISDLYQITSSGNKQAVDRHVAFPRDGELHLLPGRFAGVSRNGALGCVTGSFLCARLSNAWYAPAYPVRMMSLPATANALLSGAMMRSAPNRVRSN
jgi:hypothetical protein